MSTKKSPKRKSGSNGDGGDAAPPSTPRAGSGGKGDDEPKELLDAILKGEQQIAETRALEEQLSEQLSELIERFCARIGARGVTHEASGRTLYFGSYQPPGGGKKKFFIKSAHSPRVPQL